MNQKKIQAMRAGGHLLAQIRDHLATLVKPGVTSNQIEAEALKRIQKTGGQPSFKLVKGYHHATCISVNDGIVHGIPNDIPFKDGDLVTIDLGLYYQGFHTDTALTVVAGSQSTKQLHFLNAGRNALSAGIKAAIPGNKVSDISRAIQDVIETAGYNIIHDLTGHGVGKLLHEDPYVPNFVSPYHHDQVLKEGMTLALEPMYSMGSSEIKTIEDGWGIVTADGSLSAQFEHSIVITQTGPQILTQ